MGRLSLLCFVSITYHIINLSRNVTCIQCVFVSPTNKAPNQLFSIHLDDHFPEMLLIPHVLITLLGLLELEDPRVHHRLDLIRIDRLIHLLELQSRAHQDPAHNTDMVQALQEAGLVPWCATQEPDDGNHAVDLDGIETLRHGCGTPNLEDVINALFLVGEFLGLFSPIGVGFIVDDVMGTEILEFLGLFLRACRRDDGCTGGSGELDGEQADAAGALGQDYIAWLEGFALETIQGIPGSDGGAGQGACFLGGEGFRFSNQAVLFEDAVFAEGAREGAAEAGANRARRERAGDVALVEERGDFVALLEAVNATAGGEDLAGCIGAGNDGESDWEGVFALYE